MLAPTSRDGRCTRDFSGGLVWNSRTAFLKSFTINQIVTPTALSSSAAIAPKETKYRIGAASVGKST
jgi:hypothetical protein